MNSFISEMPGPAVGVKARAPAQLAPITMPTAASLVLGLQDREPVLLGLRIAPVLAGRSS